MSFAMNATANILKPTARPGSAIPFLKALDYADKISDWISHYCRQIEPVGELRRRCPSCSAVELLVIPRFQANSNLLFNFLNEYVQNDTTAAARWRHSTGRADLQGLPPAPHDLTAMLMLPKCPLVIHTATPETWVLRLFESTGSIEHLASIMQRVRSLPGIWEHGEMIRVRNKPVTPKSEGDIYDILNMDLVPPRKRAS